jgi:outer membrane receptor protein involved in Fe transport
MNNLKSSFISASLALLLSTSLYGQDIYNIKSMNLKGALEQIAKDANLSFLADGKLLKDKKSSSIKGIEGTKNALKEALKGTNLEAIIKDDTIVIKKKKVLKVRNSSKTNLGDIVIIGNKLERNLQETVASVQIYDESSLNNSGSLNDMYDIFRQSSNFNRTVEGFNIRGVATGGITESYTGPSAINVTVDSVSIGKNAFRDDVISTWDVEQVELIKGPQSTTGGRSSLAGAVVFKTKDPEFESNGAAQVSVGSDANNQLSVMQTGAVTDKLAVRIALDQKYSDGFVTNKDYRGDKYNEQDILNARIKSLYQFDNEGQLLLTLSKSDFEEKGTNRIFIDSADNEDITDDMDSYAHSLEYTYPINDKWSFKSLTSYSDEDREYNAGNDSTVSLNREADSLSQEFQFNYHGTDSKSVIGLYYSRGEAEDLSALENFDVSTAFGIAGLTINSDSLKKDKYSNAAVYFNTDYSLNDRLTLLIGARIDKDTRESSSTAVVDRSSDHGAFVNNLIDNQLNGLNGTNNAKDNTTNFVPKLGVNYKLTEEIYTGFSYSKGYRPGGTSTNPITGEVREYDTEENDNFELSFKSLLLDNKLQFNANIFYTKWKDQQVSEKGTSGSTLDVITTNAGESTLKGIEIDTTFKLNSEVDLYANAAFTRATFDNYITGTTNNSGNVIEKTPKLTGNIGANYRNGQGYFIGGNISYISKQYTNHANSRVLPSHSIANVKVGYEQADWSIYAYANNLFDKVYEVQDYSNGDYELGDPRVVGINLKFYW